jgi:integrase
VVRARRGFGRLRRLPSGRYQASYVGPDDKLYTAKSTFAAKEDGEAWLTDRRREIDRELWSPPATTEQKKVKAQNEIKFADYAEKWVKGRRVKGRPLKPRTVAHYNKLLEQHINPTFGKKALRSITRESVERWHTKVAADAPVTRAHAYSLLRTVLETARTTDKIIDVNPAAIAGAGASPPRTVRPKPVTVKELEVIVEEMPERLRAIILLATWTALRFGELVELRRGDVDLDDQVITVTRAAVRTKGKWIEGEPKSEAGVRSIAIPPNIVPAIRQHLDDHVGPRTDALLFPAKNGGHLQPSTLYRHFYRARDAAKRPKLRFHDLRHSGAVMAAQSGATLAELMARLGHSTHQAALRYQHQAEGRDREIAARMANLAKQDTPPES